MDAVLFVVSLDAYVAVVLAFFDQLEALVAGWPVVVAPSPRWPARWRGRSP